MAERTIPSKYELHENHGPWPKSLQEGLSLVGQIIGGEFTHWSNFANLHDTLRTRGLTPPSTAIIHGKKGVQAVHVSDILVVAEAFLFLRENRVHPVNSTPSRRKQQLLNQFQEMIIARNGGA